MVLRLLLNKRKVVIGPHNLVGPFCFLHEETVHHLFFCFLVSACIWLEVLLKSILMPPMTDSSLAHFWNFEMERKQWVIKRYMLLIWAVDIKLSFWDWFGARCKGSLKFYQLD